MVKVWFFFSDIFIYVWLCAGLTLEEINKTLHMWVWIGPVPAVGASHGDSPLTHEAEVTLRQVSPQAGSVGTVPSVADRAPAGWAGGHRAGLLRMDVLGQLERIPRERARRAMGHVHSSWDASFYSAHNISCSIQNRIQNSFGNYFSLWNNSYGFRSMSCIFSSLTCRSGLWLHFGCWWSCWWMLTRPRLGQGRSAWSGSDPCSVLGDVCVCTFSLWIQ